MNRNRRIAAMALALFMLVGLLAGCTGGTSGQAGTAKTSVLNTESAFPVVKDGQDITLKMLGRRGTSQGEWQDLKFFKKLQEVSGVTLDIETVMNESWDTTISVRFASSDLPDFIYAGKLTTAQEVNYGDDQSMLIAIEDMLEEHMPNLWARLEESPHILNSMTTPGGHVYSLPWINDMMRDLTTKYWINNVWIENLNMSEPETVDELYALFTAFKNDDPNGNGQADEIPVSWGKGIAKFYRTIAWWGRAIETDQLMGNEDGNVYFAPLTPEWKEMITFWSNAWADGLIDPEIFEQDENQLKAKGQAEGDQVLGFFERPGAFLTIPAEQNEDYIALKPVVANAGDTPVWPQTSGLSRGTLAITKVCEYPEVVLRMMDWVYEWKENEGGIYNMRGEAGVDFYYVDENGEQTEQAAKDRKYLVLEFEGYDSFEVKRAQTLTANSGSTTPGIGGGTMPQVIYPLNDWINVQVEKQLYPYWVLPYPDVHLKAEVTDKAATLKADLTTVIEIWTGQFITGEKSIEKDYDAFIAEIKGIGAEEFQQIYQDAYDTWAGK
ncbi:MAG: hypothetical protein ACOX8S_09500 [Christensenellales bacterium]|jgi:putative aldouronate transport system substrate-binding protein